jgi:murein DD-endopeptidase MepM/ murein hydrolase activator NlpD
MGRRRAGKLRRFPFVVGGAVVVLLFFSTASSAQFPLFTPTPKPTATPPEPTLTPPPTASPTPQPVPTTGVPLPGEPTAKPKKDKATPTPLPTLSPGADDALPPGLDPAEFDFEIPTFKRTAGHNTAKLVRLLSPLTEIGVPLEDVLVEGMGRFPVAGLAYYSDDWLNPRYTPKPHLHHGLDIFADFGTPIRSPDKGVVSSFGDGGAGGIAVWVRGSDGTSYYFAHMLERAEDLYVGQRVRIGTVLGYVGDTGNAQGGAPHLHFELHPGGGAAVPPKPSVDAWLEEAEEIAPNWVAAQLAQFKSGGAKGGIASPTAASAFAKKDEIETSMLLTLLDPVGGSVGMLPKLGLTPRRSGLVSDRLFKELIRQRVAGHLFVPSDGPHGD